MRYSSLKSSRLPHRLASICHNYSGIRILKRDFYSFKQELVAQRVITTTNFREKTQWIF